QARGAGDERLEATVERSKFGVYGRGGQAEHDLADLRALGVDGGFREVERRVALGCRKHLVESGSAGPLVQQRLDSGVLAIQVAGELIAIGIAVDDEADGRI